MPKAKSKSIANQIDELRTIVAFLECTEDIDAAIEKYECAMKVAHELTTAIQDRHQLIEKISLKYSKFESKTV